MWLQSTFLFCAIGLALANRGIIIIQSNQIDDEHMNDQSSGLKNVEFEKMVHRSKRDTASSNDTNQIKSVYDYLESGKTRMKNDTRYEDVVLVLGNSGAGKSTLVQLLAGNNSNLISENKCHVFKNKLRCEDNFKITDTNNKIGSSVVYSHTEVPERVFDSNTNTVYYDCPGFNDNRDAKHDIGGTYFIKRITDNARAVKFIFVVSYSAVTGMEREKFMQLAKHATNMIQNITKFKDSIAMVVTKVNDHQKTDEEIISTITMYLEQVYQALEDNENLSGANKKIMQFIDILLTVNDDNNYSRIGLFRQPKKSGPLSNIFEAQQNKQLINTILHKNIKYIKHDDANDFGYTISDNSKNYVNGLVVQISKNILFDTENITNKLTQYFNNLTEKMIIKIESFNTDDDEFIVSDTDYSFLTDLDTASNTISMLVKEINNATTPEEFSNKITRSIDDILKIPISLSDFTSDILTQTQYLEFFRDVAKFNTYFNQKELQSCFQGLIITLGHLKTHIADKVKNNFMINNIESKIKSIFDDSGKEIQEYFSRKVETVDELNTIFNQIDSAYFKLSKTYKDAMNLHETNEWIQRISRGIHDLNKTDINIISASYKISNTIKYSNRLELLHAVSNQPLSHPITYSTGLRNVIEYLNNSQKWYQFLIRLYEKLSAYNIQSDTSTCRELANKVNFRILNGTVSNIMLIPFLEKCYSGYKMESNDIENIPLTQAKLDTLKTILYFTLMSTSVGSCDPESSNKLVIKGQYAKLSEIDRFMHHRNCKTPLKFIEIFALKKVFIDTDLDKTGEKVQLSIVAPTWDIQGHRKIILDGKMGAAHTPRKAQNGFRPGMDGENGKHGLPGDPGGILFGLGMEFINIQNLIITSNGGQGGPGQDGGNGMYGKDDKEPNIDIDEIVRYEIYDECRKDEKVLMNLLFPQKYEIMDCSGLYKEWRFVKKLEPMQSMVYKYEWNFFPSAGEGKSFLGGNGGNGGNGGIGGEPGGAHIIDLLNNSTLITIGHKGHMGSAGVGGTGGIGGKCGDILTITYEINMLDFIQNKEKSYSSCVKYRYSEGTPGVAGFTSVNIQYPPEAVKISKPSNIINSYKEYARENLSDSIQKMYLQNFLNLLLSRKAFNGSNE